MYHIDGGNEPCFKFRKNRSVNETFDLASSSIINLIQKEKTIAMLINRLPVEKTSNLFFDYVEKCLLDFAHLDQFVHDDQLDGFNLEFLIETKLNFELLFSHVVDKERDAIKTALYDEMANQKIKNVTQSISNSSMRW